MITPQKSIRNLIKLTESFIKEDKISDLNAKVDEAVEILNEQNTIDLLLDDEALAKADNATLEKLWNSILLVFPGLSPDETPRENEEISTDIDDPNLSLNDIYDEYYKECGWPTIFKYILDEMWTRMKMGKISEDILYGSNVIATRMSAYGNEDYDAVNENVNMPAKKKRNDLLRNVEDSDCVMIDVKFGKGVTPKINEMLKSINKKFDDEYNVELAEYKIGYNGDIQLLSAEDIAGKGPQSKIFYKSALGKYHKSIPGFLDAFDDITAKGKTEKEMAAAAKKVNAALKIFADQSKWKADYEEKNLPRMKVAELITDESTIIISPEGLKDLFADKEFWKDDTKVLELEFRKAPKGVKIPEAILKLAK